MRIPTMLDPAMNHFFGGKPAGAIAMLIDDDHAATAVNFLRVFSVANM